MKAWHQASIDEYDIPAKKANKFNLMIDKLKKDGNESSDLEDYINTKYVFENPNALTSLKFKIVKIKPKKKPLEFLGKLANRIFQ